jgi:predicted lipoprotein with Yx(FWY)xxD motif
VAHQRSTLIVAAGAFAATFLLASACGGDDYGLTGTGTTADLGAARPPAAGPAASGAKAGTGRSAARKPATRKPAAEPAGRVTSRLTATSVAGMGDVVTDAKGWILYRFDEDRADPSTSVCTGRCARVWPPVLAGATLELSGIPAREVATITRADGGQQVTIGGRPVYRYVGDRKPGTWKGQNVGRAWFAVHKDGSRNRTCLPEPPPQAVEPPAEDGSAY